nr:hypothetical protein [uncultured Flavobacterium sp.]
MKNDNFHLDMLTIKEEFNEEYKKLQPFGKSLRLAKSFEDDDDFMLAFEEEFSRTSTKPDLDKYWIGLFTKKKLDEYILIQNGIIQDKKTTLTETLLKKKEIEFNELSNKNKLPKECYIHQIEETNIYKQFRAIEDIYNRFKEMKGFDSSADSLRQQAEEFGKGLISEIQNINYEPIKNKIIEVIINDKQNDTAYTNGFFNNNFNKKEFDDNYAKAKMYLDNYLSKYLDTKNQHIKTEKLIESTNSKNIVKIKKTPEKWFALLYWFELEVNGEKPPTNHEGAFIRKEIEEIRKKETGKDGQSFYREFKEINIDDEKELNIKFGKDWKTKIIELSNNNEKIKQYLISKYTS